LPVLDRRVGTEAVVSAEEGRVRLVLEGPLILDAPFHARAEVGSRIPRDAPLVAARLVVVAVVRAREERVERVLHLAHDPLVLGLGPPVRGAADPEPRVISERSFAAGVVEEALA
jgi:hypothetical protein